eukprot:6209228-Pleurochrysis_carterae.AAC.4
MDDLDSRLARASSGVPAVHSSCPLLRLRQQGLQRLLRRGALRVRAVAPAVAEERGGARRRSGNGTGVDRS